MTRRQFEEWQAFYRLDPWDGERDDLLTGKLCSTIAAAHGIETKPSDFMPDWLKEETALPTQDEHNAHVDQLFAALDVMSKPHGSTNRINGNQDKRVN